MLITWYHSHSLHKPPRLLSTSKAPAGICAEVCPPAQRWSVKAVCLAAEGPHRALAPVLYFAACRGPVGPVERAVASFVQTHSCQRRPGATSCRVRACMGACGSAARLKYSNHGRKHSHRTRRGSSGKFLWSPSLACTSSCRATCGWSLRRFCGAPCQRLCLQ